MIAVPTAIFCGGILFVLGAILIKSSLLRNFYRSKDENYLFRTISAANRISKTAIAISILSPIPLGFIFGMVNSRGMIQFLMPVAMLLLMVSAEVFWMSRHVANLAKNLLEMRHASSIRG